MKPVAFEYTQAESTAAALTALRASDGAARFIAGGQTLGPLMNLRLARPVALIDISKAAELRIVRAQSDSIVFGAAITHAEIEDGHHPDPVNGAMRQVAGQIAYRVIRNRGTLGGSVAHADPSADWLSFLTVTSALIHVAGHSLARIVPMAEFTLSAYITTLGDGELITAVEVPRYSAQARFGYHKLCRKVGEFADAIGAVLVDPDRRYCKVVAGAIGASPAILRDTASELARTAALPARNHIESELLSLDPNRDAVRVRMAAVAVRRAIAQALDS